MLVHRFLVIILSIILDVTVTKWTLLILVVLMGIALAAPIWGGWVVLGLTKLGFRIVPNDMIGPFALIFGLVGGKIIQKTMKKKDGQEK